MPDLAEQLRSYVDRSAEPITVNEIEMTRAPRSPRRFGAAQVAAVLVLVAATVGTLVMVVRDDDPAPRVATERPPTTAAASGDPWPDEKEGAWMPLPPSSVDGRVFPTITWTGTELVVWGGEAPGNTTWHDTGAAYDPRRAEWRQLADGPLAARSEHAAVWTGTEVVVCCGAVIDPGGSEPSAAAYDPGTDSWRSLAPSPLADDAFLDAVWQPERGEVVFGGGRGPTARFAAYAPATDTWRELAEIPRAVSLGSASLATLDGQLYAWIGDSAEAFVYAPDDDAWRPLPPPPARITTHTIVSTGTELIVWGDAENYNAAGHTNPTAAAYDPGTGQWRALPEPPLPPLPQWNGVPWSESAVWAGDRLVVWTGAYSADPATDTATVVLAYDPNTDAWERATAAPFDAHHPPMVWADGRVVVLADRVYSMELSE